MNRAAECVCPSLFSEAPLRLSLPGTAFISSIGASVLAQNASRQTFQTWNSVAAIKLFNIWLCRRKVQMA